MLLNEIMDGEPSRRAPTGRAQILQVLEDNPDITRAEFFKIAQEIVPNIDMAWLNFKFARQYDVRKARRQAEERENASRQQSLDL